MPLPLAIPIAAAAIGAVAGGMKDKSQSQNTSWIDAGRAGAFEALGQGYLQSGVGDFNSFVQRGPSGYDVTQSINSSRSLAEYLERLSRQGGSDPTEQDITGANSLASKLFGAQRVAMGQAFEDQLTAANRQAALMGRAGDDPILRAKLAQEQTRQSSLLEAQQGSWAQNYALQQPFQRLDFMSQRTNLLGGLASQALANRQSLAAMGEGIMNNERNFRLATATRGGTQSGESGGGLKGVLTGSLAGFGAGAGAINAMQTAPTATTVPNQAAAVSAPAPVSYSGLQAMQGPAYQRASYDPFMNMQQSFGSYRSR